MAFERIVLRGGLPASHFLRAIRPPTLTVFF